MTCVNGCVAFELFLMEFFAIIVRSVKCRVFDGGAWTFQQLLY